MIHSFDKTCNNDVVSRAFIVPIFQFQLLTPWVTGFFLGWGNPCGVKIILWISLKVRGLLFPIFSSSGSFFWSMVEIRDIGSCPLLLADLESVPIYARRWSTPPQGRWSSWLSQCCCWTVSSGSLAPTYTEMFPLLSVMYVWLLIVSRSRMSCLSSVSVNMGRGAGNFCLTWPIKHNTGVSVWFTYCLRPITGVSMLSQLSLLPRLVLMLILWSSFSSSPIRVRSRDPSTIWSTR